MKITKIKYDFIIVGAGIIGLSHAITAIEQGYSVLILEKDSRAFGASIQNFGLIWPIGQPAGYRFDRSMRSREKWLEMSEKAGYWVSKSGSLFLAYHQAEMDLLLDYHQNMGYKTALLKPDQIQTKFPYVNMHGLLGGLFSQTELTIDPRKAIYALTNWLSTQDLCDVQFNEHVTHAETGWVQTTKTKYEAEHILICSGADYQYLFTDVFLQASRKKCKLQMMRTQPVPNSFVLGAAVCGGLSLKHFDSFHACNSYGQLSQYISATFPEHDKHGIHVLVAQNWELELIIGDSHEYANSFDTFNREDINELILSYYKRLMKLNLPPLKYVWNGIYAKMENQTELVVSPCRGVTILNGFGGAGLTMSFGFAEHFINEML